jgi:hypothetical protein
MLPRLASLRLQRNRLTVQGVNSFLENASKAAMTLSLKVYAVLSSGLPCYISS